MSRRRVVVTGLGCVSPVGNTVAQAWTTLLAGQSGIGLITKFDASALACKIAGEVKNFDLESYMSAKEARTMDTFIHYGIAAAAQAVADGVWPPARPWTNNRPAGSEWSLARALAACP